MSSVLVILQVVSPQSTYAHIPFH